MAKPGIYLRIPAKNVTAFICPNCKRRAVFSGLASTTDPTALAKPICNCQGSFTDDPKGNMVVLSVAEDGTVPPLTVGLADSLEENDFSVSELKTTAIISNVDPVKLTAKVQETVGGYTIKVTSNKPPAIFNWLRGSADKNDFTKDITFRATSVGMGLQRRAADRWVKGIPGIGDKFVINLTALLYALAINNAVYISALVRDYLSKTPQNRCVNEILLKRLWDNREYISGGMSSLEALQRLLIVVCNLSLEKPVNEVVELFKIDDRYMTVDIELLFIIAELCSSKMDIRDICVAMQCQGGYLRPLAGANPAYIRKAFKEFLKFGASRLHEGKPLVDFFVSASQDPRLIDTIRLYNDIMLSPDKMNMLKEMFDKDKRTDPLFEIRSYICLKVSIKEIAGVK